ncbi:MAG TPA: serine/threonine-protein kinase, partial [Gaiellaceae bacterium]|nr:serine/threonine-protein kinase [Gaiellaceae bacterium]
MTGILGLPPRYVSLEMIASGGMADVYRGRDAVLEREVAIKVLGERHADDDELRARFSREAQTAASLSGEPGVITIFDVGEAAGRPFMVMELLPGGSLADRLQAGPIPVAQALGWLEQAGRALDLAHARGIVHRDVKPGNLMLSADGNVSVTDFGIARAAGASPLTATGTIMGTSGYMSPEQA